MLFFNVLRVFKVLHSRTLNQNNALSFSIIASRGRRGRDDLVAELALDAANQERCSKWSLLRNFVRYNLEKYSNLDFPCLYKRNIIDLRYEDTTTTRVPHADTALFRERNYHRAHGTAPCRQKLRSDVTEGFALCVGGQ